MQGLKKVYGKDVMESKNGKNRNVWYNMLPASGIRILEKLYAYYQ